MALSRIGLWSSSLIILTGLTMTACGGGGDSSSSTPSVTPVVQTPPAPVTPEPTPEPEPEPVPEPIVVSSSATTPRPVNTDPNAPLASIDFFTGELFYGAYANQDQTNSVNLLPDFSHAGYMGGGVALPTYASIPVAQTLSPQDADGDDLERIQAAIDAVSQMSPDARGIRGAVLLQAGSYNVSQAVAIRSSGVVLRGEGQGPDGTILKSTSRTERDEVIFVGGEPDDERTDAASDDRTTRITQSFVPTGSISVEVGSTEGYAVGDRIAISRTPNEFWLGADGVDTAQFGWTTSQYTITYDRTVTAIEGNVIFFDAPTVEVIEDQYGGGEVFRTDVSGRITQVGIENLSVESLFSNDTSDENRAFFGINFDDVEDSWIRDSTSRFASHGFNMNDGAVHNTMQNVSYLDPNFDRRGGRLYPFNFEGGQMNLVQRCFGDEGRHTLTSGSRALGPNVFLDCVIERSTDDDGPHQRWATGTLFDNARGQLLRFQNRQTSGTGHGWAGGQQVAWNSEYDAIVVQAPTGAMNFSIGTIAAVVEGFFPVHPFGIFESDDAPLVPRSLYLQQLEDRLGIEAVEAITLPQQRQGRIWDMLSDWGGVGTLVPIE